MLQFLRTSGLCAAPSIRWAPRGRLLWVSLLLLFGSPGAAEAAETPRVPVTSGGPGPQFAIADFDGDLRPDLASVQAGQGTPETAESNTYWIQVQLSSVGRQSIRLVAPVGGLLIEARDVNGDNAVDLVVATAWLRQPVAILLNDGHGGFSQVSPTRFPGAFSESKANWESRLSHAIDAVGVPAPSGTGLGVQTRALPHFARQAGSSLPVSAGFPPTSFLVSRAERAPPSEVHRF